jgi:hypothetical protein
LVGCQLFCVQPAFPSTTRISGSSHSEAFTGSACRDSSPEVLVFATCSPEGLVLATCSPEGLPCMPASQRSVPCPCYSFLQTVCRQPAKALAWALQPISQTEFLETLTIKPSQAVHVVTSARKGLCVGYLQPGRARACVRSNCMVALCIHKHANPRSHHPHTYRYIQHDLPAFPTQPTSTFTSLQSTNLQTTSNISSLPYLVHHHASTIHQSDIQHL